MQKFSELQISNYTKERLSHAHFSTPTPVQAAAIPQALEGKDVLATAQTGTGKKLSPAALVVGGLPEAKQLSAIRAGARLVVATPGRLEDYLDRKLINFRALRVLVLDEADRMLHMGFLPAIRRIAAVL